MLETLEAEPTSPSQLADVMRISRSAITKLADRLLQKSLVARGAKREDGHLQMLALTTKGAKLVPMLAKLVAETEMEFLHGLPDDDRAQFELFLKNLVRKHRQKKGY